MPPRPTVLALALVVLVAGCGGTGDGGTTVETTDAETPTTDAPGATGTTPAAEPTRTTPADDAATTSPTTAADGDGTAQLSPRRLRRSHLQALRSAGSFASTLNLTVEGPNGTLRVHQRGAVDLDAGRARSTTNASIPAAGTGGSIQTARYTAGNVTYQRLVTTAAEQRQARYAVARAPYDRFSQVRPVNASTVAVASLVGAAARGDWRRVGTEQYRGQTVTRYESTGSNGSIPIGEFAPGRDRGPRRGQVQNVTRTMLVDEAGVVRRVEARVTARSDGQTTRTRLVATVDGVGSTTVAEPGWLADARNRTGQS